MIILCFQTGAVVKLGSAPVSDPEDTLFTISGTLKKIEDALDMLTDTIHKVRGRFCFLFLKYSQQTWFISIVVRQCSSDEDLTLKLIVPNSQCGRIIGTKGHRIRKIEDSTGAEVYVSTAMMTNREKRKVIITGVPESVTQGIIEVLEIVMKVGEA